MTTCCNSFSPLTNSQRERGWEQQRISRETQRQKKQQQQRSYAPITAPATALVPTRRKKNLISLDVTAVIDGKQTTHICNRHYYYYYCLGLTKREKNKLGLHPSAKSKTFCFVSRYEQHHLATSSFSFGRPSRQTEWRKVFPLAKKR